MKLGKGLSINEQQLNEDKQSHLNRMKRLRREDFPDFHCLIVRFGYGCEITKMNELCSQLFRQGFENEFSIKDNNPYDI